MPVRKRCNRSSEVRCFFFYPGDLQSFARRVGGLQQRKARRQKHIFVHVYRADDLLRDQITAAVAGDDDRIDAFGAEIVDTKDRGQPIDKRHDIGTHRIVVVRTDQYDYIAFDDRGIDLFGHDAAVEAIALLAEMQTVLVFAAAAVPDLTVTEGNLCDVCFISQCSGSQLPQGQAVGGLVIARVDSKKLRAGDLRRCESAQLLNEQTAAFEVGGIFVCLPERS